MLRLKQINIQLATKIQHLEFSCSEKVRRRLGKHPVYRLFPPSQASALVGPLAQSPTPLGQAFLVLPDSAQALLRPAAPPGTPSSSVSSPLSLLGPD